MQVVTNVSAYRRVSRQFHQTIGGIRQTQLLLRTKHALGFHTAQFRCLDIKITRQYRADNSQRGLQPSSGIRGTAYDLHCFSTCIHLANTQFVRVRVLLGADNFSHYYSAEYASHRVDGINFQPCHSDLVS